MTASGTPAPTYQQYKNSLVNPISHLRPENPSATNATLTLAQHLIV